MNKLKKLISKYAIILAIYTLIWQYANLVSPIEMVVVDNAEEFFFSWSEWKQYMRYFFRILFAVLLFFDVKKLNSTFYLIPVIGLIYPLLGITVFLIWFIHKEAQSKLQDQN